MLHLLPYSHPTRFVEFAARLVAFTCFQVLIVGIAAAQNTTQDNLPSRFSEELTWEEVKKEVATGTTSILIPVGGVEPNGPYVVTGKHNYVVRAKVKAMTRKLQNALIAPVVPFVPEGDFDPPTKHMMFSFQRLIIDICSSYRVHGFQNIILLGDGGESQSGLKKVAELLNAKWHDTACRIHYIPEFYDAKGLTSFLADRGVTETSEGIHDSLKVSAILATIDPDLIRFDRRKAAGNATINGVSLIPIEKTIELGNEILDWYADRTVAAIERSIQQLAVGR